jgi:hypothetical protein
MVMLIDLFHPITNIDNITSDAIKNKFTDYIPDILELLNATCELAENNHRNIDFELTDTMVGANFNANGFRAQTMRYRTSITITLNSNLPDDKIDSVFVHELCEANYLAHELTSIDDIIDEQEQMNTLKSRFIETISHPY